MESLLTEDAMYDIHFEPNLENFSDHKLTLDEIKTILDLPASAMNDLTKRQGEEESEELSDDIKHLKVKGEMKSPQGKEPQWGQESSSSHSSETSPSPAHIVHGILNININKILDWPVSANKQTDPNARAFKIFNEESPINKFGLSIYSGQDLFQTVKTETDLKPPVEHLMKSKVAKYSCTICTKPALKYSSYGGRACSSCRSFFRRSSQSNYHTVYHCKRDKNCVMDPNSRKNCQYCRFQTCLKSGMRITWVLSDEERTRRFSKSSKSDLELLKSKSGDMVLSPIRSSPLYLSFTIEEQKVLEDTHDKFQVPWLQNFLVFNRQAATNLIEFTYGIADLKNNTWGNLRDSMHFNFTRYILPKFTELSSLPSSDFGQIMNSPSSGIELFFRGCFVLQMEQDVCGKPFNCPMASQVKSVANNEDLVDSLGLSDFLSRLELFDDDKDMWMASYDEVYPRNWAGDDRKEKRHRNIVTRIIDWPKLVRDEFDIYLVTLMSLILTLNVDFYPLARRDIMEKVQLKYILILQRYLRSKLEAENANKKFLEAMLLIADTREAWEIANGRIENY